MAQTLSQLWQVIQSLQPAERQQLRAWLEAPPAEQSVPPERLVEKLLFERGSTKALQKGPVDVAAFRNWLPVRADGKPVSEILVEDRR